MPKFELIIHNQTIPLLLGDILSRSHIDPKSDEDEEEAVGLVTANPKDKSELGLVNLTSTDWNATLSDGASSRIEPGDKIKLVDGVRLMIEEVDCLVRVR